MKLRWTKHSLRDLIEIGRYIARDKPEAARRWVERLRRRARTGAAHPYAGRKVPELGRDEIREVLVRNYRIVYESRQDELRILTVFEGHRRLPESAIEPSDSMEEESD